MKALFVISEPIFGGKCTDILTVGDGDAMAIITGVTQESLYTQFELDVRRRDNSNTAIYKAQSGQFKLNQRLAAVWRQAGERIISPL